MEGKTLDHGIWLLIIGGLMLLFAIGVYVWNSSNSGFPILLALGGIFLVGAQTVKTKIPGFIDIEMTKAMAKGTDVNGEAVLEQAKALAAIRDEQKASRDAFIAYQKAVSERFDQLNAKPIPVSNQVSVDASDAQLDARLAAVKAASNPVAQVNRDLKRITKRLF